MQVNEYIGFDGVGLRELIVRREVSADEVEEAARDALDAAHTRVNGLAAPAFEPALDHDADGPLGGVPFLYKDVGPMAADVPFFGGCRAIPGIRPERDSELMRRVRAAGLKTLGMTTTPELGISLATEPARTGPTRNPRDPRYSAGGSSGGSAALVAAGAVPIAHASDGAGSLRVPASCCGIIGLKPTRARTPCGPDIGEALFGLSEHFGVTRSLRDTARLLDALSGPTPGDKYVAPPPARAYELELGKDPGRLRVALWTAGAEPEVAEAAEHAAYTLAERGHDVELDVPPIDQADVLAMLGAGLVAMAEPMLTAPRRAPEHLLEALTNTILADVAEQSALDLMAGLAAQNRVSRALGAYFERIDIVVSPTLARTPVLIGELNYDDPARTPESWLRTLLDYSPFTAPFNVSGQPAISLPLASSAGGLPIGVQLVGAYGREDLLLRVASQLLPVETRRA